MKESLLRQAEKLKQKNHDHKRWQKAVSILACVVVFCTVYALILPAVTMEKTAYCGKEEHTHTEDYVKIPDGFYMERLLWIEKKVLKDGSEITADDTFYATVNEVNPNTGDETTLITVELSQNDKVMVSFPVTDLEDIDTVHTYRVFESDADGNPVNKNTFGYEVGGEGNIEFVDSDDNEKTITITNTVITTTPGVTPGVTPGGSTSTTPKKVKTGDNTQIVMWMVVLFVAAAAVGFVIGRKRKK